MAGGHVSIQVLDAAEQMVLGWPALCLTEEKPFAGRILAAGGHMFPHGLLDLERFATVRAEEHLIWCRPIQTMNSSSVLPELLFGGIVLVTLVT